MIRLRAVEVRAGGTRIGPLGLTVAEGAYSVVLGPSGAGKTILLEGVAGLRPLAGGRVELGGADVSTAPPERRGVGLVFQDGLLFPHLTVAQNVTFGLRRDGRRSAHDREARLDELAGELGIAHLLSRRPSTLSGGERQRVALARALAPRPHVLLLDEPLGALDGEAREVLQDVLRSVCRTRGVAVLHVTHDLTEAFSLADTCAVLLDGLFRQVAPPAELVQRPNCEAVARLVGARNVLSARVDADDPHVVALEGGQRLRLDRPASRAEVRVVIRPEDVLLGEGVQAPGVTRLTATVERVLLQGSHALLRVDLPPRLELLVPLRQVPASCKAQGGMLDIGIPATAVHVLPDAGE